MVSFFWFRATLTIPASAAGFATAGAKTVLTVNVDDYAEVWVNGEMPRAAGRPSPAAIQGFNMPNRLVLRDTVDPGREIRDRGVRHQWADFGGAGEFPVVSRGEGRVLPLTAGARAAGVSNPRDGDRVRLRASAASQGHPAKAGTQCWAPAFAGVTNE